MKLRIRKTVFGVGYDDNYMKTQDICFVYVVGIKGSFRGTGVCPEKALESAIDQAIIYVDLLHPKLCYTD